MAGAVLRFITLEEDMRLSALVVCLIALCGAPAHAQPNIVSPETTCDELVGAYDMIINDVRSHNYAEVIAKAFFTFKIARRTDGQPTTLEEVAEYVTEESRRDPGRFVLFAVGDLQTEMTEKKCTFTQRSYKWNAP
jgi:hypothetical protein